MADKCKECGCICAQCRQNDESHADMHLHVEIEHLRQRLLERDSHIVTMETQFLNEADKFPNGELASMKEEMLTWQDKYARLYEAHKRVQKVNQNLEDKLLRIVDKCETEKSAFTKDIATLSHRLADANYTIHRLTQDNEKYRNDVNLAIQLLQCKPSNFIGQRYDSLPSEVQAKVRTYVAQKKIPSDTASTPDVKSITVPISTFPPTAMVYNVTKTNNVDKDSDDESDDSKPPVDVVSAAIMAKVLEERERERVFAKHCDTCTCHKSILTNDAETQTTGGRSDSENLINPNIYVENFNGHDNMTESTNQTKTQNLKEDCKDNVSVNNTNKRTSYQLQYVNEKVLPQNSLRKDLHFSNVSEKDSPNSMHLKTADNSQLKMTRKSYSSTSSDGNKDNSNKMNHHYSLIKQATFNHNSTEKSLSKTNAHEKLSRQSNRGSKKSDTQSTYRLTKTSNEWKKYEKVPCEIDLIDLKQNSMPQRQIDVINDRIWKNDGKSKSNDVNKIDLTNSNIETTLNFNQQPQRQKSEVSDYTIDVINDRTWKTSVDSGARSENNVSKPRLTLIEVKPLIVDSTALNLQQKQQQNNSRLQQSEDTASPSFSSDSLVISSSDPPSTSSELGNSKILLNRPSVTNINNNNNSNKNNNNSLLSNWQDRTTGPRGCSVRITPGSKNILLDNAGHYQTISYTSGGNGNGRPDTVLVHGTAKSTRSGRSSSTSSDDNSPVLPSDNTQLQRVAEWIKASGPLERERNVKSVDSRSDNKLNGDMSVNTLNKALSKIKDGKLQQLVTKNKINAKNDKIFDKNSKTIVVQGDKNIKSNDCGNDAQSFNNVCESTRDCSESHGLQTVVDDNADLISFESSNDDGDNFQQFSTDNCHRVFINGRDNSGDNFSSVSKILDVKVTREMEETYLKLAASLDPGNLKLSSSESADITIEKYRKEYKRTHGQKHHEKTAGSNS